MLPKGRRRARRLAKLLAPKEYVRFDQVEIQDLGFGYDPFGLEKETAMMAFAAARFFYKYWFRVESTGIENVPQDGPVLVAPNHSGVIPIDGAMLAADLFLKMDKPRIMRATVDNFAGFLPFISTFYNRCGQIIGARRNCEELLKLGELVTLFPEGHKGVGKKFQERYQLRPFNVGFMELSLIYQVPIVPVAIIGAEEQYPYMMNLKPIAKALNFPFFPVTPLILTLGPLGMMPLPTKYYIYYGKALHVYRDYPPSTVKNPETIHKLVAMVQKSVQDLIDQGLQERESIFGFPGLSMKKLFPDNLQGEKGYGGREQSKGG